MKKDNTALVSGSELTCDLVLMSNVGETILPLKTFYNYLLSNIYGNTL